MLDNFKNLNTITDGIKRKIFKKKDVRYIIVMEKWKAIVGIIMYKKSNPLKITRDHSLKVEVDSDILLDFKFSTQDYLSKINKYFNNDKKISKIIVVQKYV